MHWYPVYAYLRACGLEHDGAAARTESVLARMAEEAPAADGAPLLREWLQTLAQEAEIEERLRAPVHAIPREWAAERFAQETRRPPADAFMRRWTLGIIETALGLLEREYRAAGREEAFQTARPRLGFSGGSEEEDSYAALAERLALSEGAARRLVFDLRTRYRELLRTQIADTVAKQEQVADELTSLLIELPPPSATPPPRSLLLRLQPEELLARGMNSVQMSTVGGLGWTPPSAEQAARLFGNFEVIALLGHGGMGAVYQARQTSLDRLVAIKLLPLEISADANFADRFRREARAMAKLSHPNIIGVYDFGQTPEGHLYFVMEYVDGAMLHDFIHHDKRGLAPVDALMIVEQICEALAYAHQQGVVHRDIKPANVMLDRRQRVKVLDFGLARLLNGEGDGEQWGTTMTGTVMGTPDYMAPEQKRGQRVDHRADVYSLGVVLYEMLCKETPQGAFELPSARCGLDKRIDTIITRAMAVQPERRFQDTLELKAAVAAVRPIVARTQKALLAKANVRQPPPPRPGRSGEKPAGKAPPQRSMPLVAGSVAAVLVLALGAGLFLTLPKRQATVQAGAAADASATTPAVKQTFDLLAMIDPVQDAILYADADGSNEWRREGKTLVNREDKSGSRLTLPLLLDEVKRYELLLTFTREAGESNLGISLPLRGNKKMPIFLGYEGEQLHGFGVLELLNPPAAKFSTGEQVGYRIVVETKGRTDWSYAVWRDGKLAAEWRGDPGPRYAFASDGMRIALAIKPQTRLRYEKIVLNVYEGEAKLVDRLPPPVSTGMAPAVRDPRLEDSSLLSGREAVTYLLQLGAEVDFTDEPGATWRLSLAAKASELPAGRLEILNLRFGAFDTPHPVTDAQLARLAPMRRLKFLEINADITGEGCKFLAGCSELERLRVHSAKLTPAIFEPLVALRRLRTLVFGGNYTDLAFGRLSDLTSAGALEELHLGRLKRDDPFFAALPKFQRLKYLNMWGVQDLSRDNVAAAAALPELERLCLRGIDAAGAVGLAEWERATKLRDLDLEHSDVREALAWVRRLPKLEHLVLDAKDVPGLAAVAGAPMLEELTLKGHSTPLTDSALAAVAKAVPDLAALRLRFHARQQLTPAGIRSLAEMPSLTAFSWNNTPLPKALLSEIAKLPHLIRLDLAEAQLRDSDLAALAGMKSLEFLNLSQNTGLTKAALDHLQTLPRLRAVNLTNTGLTRKDLPTLQKALPKVQFNF